MWTRRTGSRRTLLQAVCSEAVGALAEHVDIVTACSRAGSCNKGDHAREREEADGHGGRICCWLWGTMELDFLLSRVSRSRAANCATPHVCHKLKEIRIGKSYEWTLNPNQTKQSKTQNVRDL